MSRIFQKFSEGGGSIQRQALDLTNISAWDYFVNDVGCLIMYMYMKHIIYNQYTNFEGGRGDSHEGEGDSPSWPYVGKNPD